MGDDDEQEDLPEFYDASMGVERMNWTDPVIAAMLVVTGITTGLHNGASYILSSLRLHGRAIAEKNDFAKGAGLEIEALTDGR